MRTALILDRDRIGQEHAMFNRLCVGLLAEGIQPTRVVPAEFDPSGDDPQERRISLLPRITYRSEALPWLRRVRAGRLADELERHAPQLLHVAGQSAWSLAVAVANDLERPLVVGVWSLREALAARRLRDSGTVAAWLAPGDGIGDALRGQVDPSLVHVVAAGVPVPERCPTRAVDGASRSRFLVVLGEGANIRPWDAFLPALRHVADLPGMADLQVVLEVRGPRGHDVWRRVRDLGLLDRVCSIADAAEHRPLLLRGAALCLPEPLTSLRTIVLDAMAQGIPVAAVDMPAMDVVNDRQSVALVDKPSTELWHATILRVLEEGPQINDLVHAAWRVVRDAHRSSAQIDGVAALYRQIVTGDSLPFRP